MQTQAAGRDTSEQKVFDNCICPSPLYIVCALIFSFLPAILLNFVNVMPLTSIACGDKRPNECHHGGTTPETHDCALAW